MARNDFPTLEPADIAATRDALHAYSRILGDWAKTCRRRRKHWWHASLRPSLAGLTTGVIYGDPDFEIELNLRESALAVRTGTGGDIREELRGQPASVLAIRVRRFLESTGIAAGPPNDDEAVFDAYSTAEANRMARTLSAVAAAFDTFRAGIREETSAVQLWPHHFDLAMLWLPGDRIPGQDPDDEEYADKQMNFGFTFGDDGIPEPYFYVTAYPLPDAFPPDDLPAGTEWHTEGFTGAVLRYRRLGREPDPDAYLQALWNGMLADGKRHLAAQSS